MPPGFSDQETGFLVNQGIYNTFGLATYIELSDLNSVDENWPLNPAGTIIL